MCSFPVQIIPKWLSSSTTSLSGASPNLVNTHLEDVSAGECEEFETALKIKWNQELAITTAGLHAEIPQAATRLFGFQAFLLGTVYNCMSAQGSMIAEVKWVEATDWTGSDNSGYFTSVTPPQR